MNADKYVKVGAIGSIVALLCCVTPILVILFGVVGLGGLVAGLDYILFPALFLFIGLLIFGMYQKRKRS